MDTIGSMFHTDKQVSYKWWQNKSANRSIENVLVKGASSATAYSGRRQVQQTNAEFQTTNKVSFFKQIQFPECYFSRKHRNRKQKIVVQASVS
jgi:hypothetical protein